MSRASRDANAPALAGAKLAQVVLAKTKERSPNHPSALIWVLRCEGCGHEYGANSCDAHIRRCPNCEGAAEGFPIPQPL